MTTGGLRPIERSEGSDADDRGGFESRAEALRRAFDRGFATPPPPAPPESEDFLLVRVSGISYALRVSELGGVARGRPVLSLPSGRPEFLGLTGLRGAVVCVYSLAALLGLEGGAPGVSWLALSPGADPLGLAVQELEGFVRVPRSDALERGGSDETLGPVKGVLAVDAAVRPIVDLRLVFDTIRRSAGGAGPTRSGP